MTDAEIKLHKFSEYGWIAEQISARYNIIGNIAIYDCQARRTLRRPSKQKERLPRICKQGLPVMII